MGCVNLYLAQSLVNMKYDFGGGIEQSVFIGMIDAGYKAKRESGIYDFCLAAGGRFIPSQGRHIKHGFLSPVKELSLIHRQQLLTLVQYNDAMFKEELYTRKIMMRAGAQWCLPRNTTPEYRTHLQSEKLVEGTNAATGEVELNWKEFGPNHMGDCEKMQLVIVNFAGEILRAAEENRNKVPSGEVPILSEAYRPY